MAIPTFTSHCQPPRLHLFILNKAECPCSTRTAEQFIPFAVRCGYAYNAEDSYADDIYELLERIIRAYYLITQRVDQSLKSCK